MKSERIAIIGCSFRFPDQVNNIEDLWDALMSKRDCVKPVDRERWSYNHVDYGNFETLRSGTLKFDEWKKFDPLFFSISPKEAPFMDPQQRLMLKIVWETLEDAHIDPLSMRGTNTSVFIGSEGCEYKTIQGGYERGVGTFTSLIANYTSFLYDFRGSSVVLDTACSSSLDAIVMGCESIILGNSNYSICGGVKGLFNSDVSTKVFKRHEMLSKRGACQSFSGEADGFVRSEGIGMVLLKKLSKAIEDGDHIYGVIDAFSSSSDGSNNKKNVGSPSIESQHDNIIKAFNKSPFVKPSDIYYFECHSTGTKEGDPIETEAISRVFSNYHSSELPLYIGSAKSNFGHLEPVSGIVSLAKVLCNFKHRILSPNIHFKTPNPKIQFENWNLKL